MNTSNRSTSNLEPHLLQRLREIVGAEHVVADGVAERYRLGRLVPCAAARPGDEEQVSRVLVAATDSRLAVVPWGSGLHQAIGRRPRRYDIALDLSRLDRVLAHEPADLTATVQAGARLGALQARLEAASQFLALEPPRSEQATLGGVLAANLSGPIRCRYGTARDVVLGMRVAHADGTITKAGAKVVKNATAYDLAKLYLGSHGTLGVILEATIRLFPRPETERGWWITTADLEPAQALGDRILGSHLSPSRVELLDREAAARVGLPPGTPGVLVSCAGVRESVQAQEAEIDRLARESGGNMRPVEASSLWVAVRDFPWEERADSPHLARWRASVLPSECAKALRAIRGACRQAARIAVVATLAHGVIRGCTVGDGAEAVAAGLAAAREAVARQGGFLVVLDAPEAIRDRVEVWDREPDGFALMQRLKQAFDPLGILNPGRYVGGI